MNTYRAMWPITDESLPFLRLIQQAKRDLPSLTRLNHVRIMGAGRWSVAESRTTPGSGGITPWVLIFEAPAEQWRPADEPDPEDVTQLKADRGAVVTELDEAGLGLAEVVRRLRLKTEAFERWCYRNGHTETYRRLKSRDRGAATTTHRLHASKERASA